MREQLKWEKMNQLIPVIVQHHFDGRVLMQAYMNPEALERTLQTGRLTFWSRSRGQLWVKGETSGNYLRLHSLHPDCDGDCLLALAEPAGPTCHTGAATCFGDSATPELGFLGQLGALIDDRQKNRPADSYTTELFDAGLKRIAQKVGEEGVETALAAVSETETGLAGEAADLLFHLLVLLRARGVGLAEVIEVLRSRHGRLNPGTGRG